MITKPEGYPGYVVKDGPQGLPVGEIFQDSFGWIFWPSVYRQPVTMTLAGEIMHKLESLNGGKE